MNLSNMSLKDKIAQMFMVGVMDDDHLQTVVAQHKVGGIIHFARNGTTAKQTYDFITKAKQMSELPLFTTVDQEGGIVTRIKSGITPISGNMAVAATRDYDNAGRVSSILAEELTLLGMNMNLAPVVDVNVNPDNPVINVRSYGDNPVEVSKYALSAFQAYQSHKMFAIAKHFPGHGDTTVDSHLELPIVDHDMTRIMDVELKPFIALIEAGIQGIMISHVLFKTIDPINPATLSYKVITDLLRQKLNYKGLILTDCMEMHAISKRYSPKEAAVKSIQAGADILLYSSDLTLQEDAINGVYKAVVEGTLEESLIDTAVQRILKHKTHLNNDIIEWQSIKDKLCTTKHLIESDSIASSSLTLLGKLPFVLDEQVSYLIPESDLLLKYFPQALNYQREDVLSKLNASSKVVLFYKTKSDVLDLLNQLTCQVLLIALKSPYEMIKAYTTVLTYEMTELSIRLLKHNFENNNFEGQLPISEVL